MTVHAPSGDGLAVERQLDLAIEPAAEERVVVVAGLDRLAVDGDQVVSLLDLDPILVGGSVFVDVRDLVAAAGRVRLEVEAEVPGHDAAALAAPRRVSAGRGTGVRGVELADHLVDDVHQLVAVGDVGHQRLVLGAHRVPVGAVQLGIVEAILHATPGVVEHLLPFLRLVDPDGDVEGDPPLRAAATAAGFGAAACRPGSIRPTASAASAAAREGRHHSAAATTTAAADRRAVDRLAFLEEERAAVLGEPQVGDAAAETAAHAAGPIFVVADRGPGRAGGDPGHPLAVILDGVDRRRAATAAAAEAARAAAAGATFRADEDQRPAVVARDVVENRRRPRDLPGAPLEPGPVDVRGLGCDRPAAIRSAATHLRARLGRAVRPLIGLVRVFGELLERYAEELRRRPSFAAAVTPVAADEVDLGAVGRKAGIGLVGRVERDLLLLAAGTGDQVDVGGPRDVGLGIGDQLAIRRPGRAADRSIDGGRQLLEILAVGPDREQLAIGRHKRDRLAVGRPDERRLQVVEVGDFSGWAGSVGGDDVDLLAAALVGDERDRLAVGRIRDVQIAGGAFGELAEVAFIGRRGERLAVHGEDDPLAVRGEVIVVDGGVEVFELGQRLLGFGGDLERDRLDLPGWRGRASRCQSRARRRWSCRRR